MLIRSVLRTVTVASLRTTSKEGHVLASELHLILRNPYGMEFRCDELG